MSEESLLPEQEFRNPALQSVSDLVDSLYCDVAAYFIDWSRYVQIPYFLFGTLWVCVGEALSKWAVKTFLRLSHLNPIDLTGFLLVKFRNGIPLTRSDSTVPAI